MMQLPEVKGDEAGYLSFLKLPWPAWVAEGEGFLCWNEPFTNAFEPNANELFHLPPHVFFADRFRGYNIQSGGTLTATDGREWEFTILPQYESGREITLGFARPVNEESPSDGSAKDVSELLCMASADILAVLHSSSKIKYVSPAVLSLTGYPTEYFLNKPFPFLFENEDRLFIEKALQEAVTSNEVTRIESRLRTSTGKTIWTETVITCFLDDENHLPGFHTSTREISERKLAGEKQAEHHKVLQGILDSIPAIIFIRSADLRLLFVNRRFAELMGNSKESLLHHKLSDFPHIGGIDLFCQRDQQFLFQGGEMVNQEVLRLPDGKRVTLHTVRKLITTDGNDIRIITTCTDVSLLAESSSRMQKDLNNLKEFMFKAVHDLKGPVSAIRGLASLGEIPGSEDLQTLLRMISNQATRLDHIQAEHFKLALVAEGNESSTRIDFENIVNYVIQDYGHKDYYRDFYVNLRNPGHIKIQANEALILTLFQNLIDNAAKHRKLGQEGKVDILITQSESTATIKFRDDGPGIPLEHQEQIFSLFTQVEEDSKGSGIGLFLVKKTVERLGGKIGVESTVGVGTTFIIDLPID